jgi:hypothetical protein
MTEQPAMDHDLRSRVVGLEHASASKETRLTALEQWKGQRDIADAVREEQFRGIKDDLKTIKTNLSWIVKLIIGGIVMGVVAFLISGGFKVP